MKRSTPRYCKSCWKRKPPYYSATVLGINHVPVYVSAQTVYTNPDRMRLSGHVSKLNWDIELKIHEKETYFGCSGRMHRDLILRNNPNAIIFKNFFPIQRPTAVKQEKKIYDFVSFLLVFLPRRELMMR